MLDDQRLVSLDTLLDARGCAWPKRRAENSRQSRMIRLAGQTREFEMPRPIFTNGERTEWAAGIYNNHHTDVQMRTDIPKVLKSPTASPAQIEEARGQLASFLRDTLVGLNYAYYEPPGAQALHNNPLFVRSHDFAGDTVGGMKTLWQAPELLGAGFSGGRRRAFRRLARRSSLRLGGSRAGFHFAGQRSGADLEGIDAGAVGQRDPAALVGCQPAGASRHRSVSADRRRTSDRFRKGRGAAQARCCRFCRIGCFRSDRGRSSKACAPVVHRKYFLK